MALVYHLKADEFVKVAGRRLGLSLGRDPSSLPPVHAPQLREPGKKPEGVETGVNDRPPVDRKSPVFLVIEVTQGEDVIIGGARFCWDLVTRKARCKAPCLLIDAPKATHPVSKTDDTYRLDRASIVGGTP